MERLTRSQSRPILLYVYLAASIPHAFEIPAWVTFVCLGLSLWSYLILKQRARPLPAPALGFFALAFTSLLFLQFHTILSPDAATPLLLLLGALKLQELKKLRDAVSLLFMCALIVMAYLLYSQNIFASIYMVGLVLFIMFAFMVIHSSPKQLKEILRASPRLVAKDLLLALPIFLVFFVLFPRFSTGWGRSIEGGKTKIGFSDSFMPGEFAKLVKSMDPAFRVSFDGDGHRPHPLMKDLYWKGLVFDETDGWAWHRHPKKRPTNANNSELHVFDYVVSLEPRYQKNIFVLEKTENIDWMQNELHNPIVHEDDGVFFATWPNYGPVQYRGWTKKVLMAQELTSNEIEFYTRLPQHFSKTATDLAKRLTEQQTTLQGKILMILGFYTQQNFQYSTNAREMKDIDAFLFKEKSGFCEHFASSFALLMRSAGVPARVVSGFQGGETNTFGHYLLVRDNNAHAWVELYDTETKSWRRVDPTAAVAGDRITLGTLEPVSGNTSLLASAFYSSQMLWDSLNNRYTQMLTSYDFAEQKNLFSFAEGFSLQPYHIIFFFLLFGPVAIVVFLLSLRAKKSAQGRISPAQRLFLLLLAQLKKYGIERSPSEGPWQFALRAAKEQPRRADLILSLIAQYICWEYKTAPPTAQEIVVFKQKIKILRTTSES